MEVFMNNMIGNRIKNRRKELNITQTQIQEQTSISSGNLSCIENGKYLPSATALIELSNILDCSIDWILTGNSSISKNSSISDIGEDDYKLLELFHGMSEDDQEDMMMMIQVKYNRNHRTREQKSSLFYEKNSANEIA